MTVSAMRSGMERLLTFTVRMTRVQQNQHFTQAEFKTIPTHDNVLIPPPIEPELAKTFDRKNIHSDTISGHWAKSALEKPLANPMDTKLKLTKRKASPRL